MYIYLYIYHVCKLCCPIVNVLTCGMFLYVYCCRLLHWSLRPRWHVMGSPGHAASPRVLENYGNLDMDCTPSP